MAANNKFPVFSRLITPNLAQVKARVKEINAAALVIYGDPAVLDPAASLSRNHNICSAVVASFDVEHAEFTEADVTNPQAFIIRILNYVQAAYGGDTLHAVLRGCPAQAGGEGAHAFCIRARTYFQAQLSTLAAPPAEGLDKPEILSTTIARLLDHSISNMLTINFPPTFAALLQICLRLRNAAPPPPAPAFSTEPLQQPPHGHLKQSGGRGGRGGGGGLHAGLSSPVVSTALATQRASARSLTYSSRRPRKAAPVTATTMNLPVSRMSTPNRLTPRKRTLRTYLLAYNRRGKQTRPWPPRSSCSRTSSPRPRAPCRRCSRR